MICAILHPYAAAAGTADAVVGAASVALSAAGGEVGSTGAGAAWEAGVASVTLVGQSLEICPACWHL
jgi:hypothetical protein